MHVNSIEDCDEELSKDRLKEIGEYLENNHLKILSLRNCKISDVGFKRLMKACGKSRSLRHLSLSVGIITDHQRTEFLAQVLRKNKIIKSLHIHGNPIGDEGMRVVAEALSYNSQVTTLDVSDCHLSDASIHHLRLLLTPNSEQEGLSELILSANPRITAGGWSSLGMTVAHSPNLHSLYLDYNTLGDAGASSLLVGVAANQQIEVLDLEGTGITERTTLLILDLLQNYPGNLRKITLSENKVKKSTVAAIKAILRTNVAEDASVDASEDDFLSTTASTVSTPRDSTTVTSSSQQSESETSKDETEESDSGTVKELVLTDVEEVAVSTQKKPLSAMVGKKTKKEEEEEDLGEELREVPVFW